MNVWVGEMDGDVVVVPDWVGPNPSDGHGERRRKRRWRGLVDRAMAREIGQSFYLMGLMAVTLSAVLGLGLLAVWVLG